MIKKITLLILIISQLFIVQANRQKKNSESLPLLNTKWILEELYKTPVLHNSDTAFIIFYDTYKFSGNSGKNIFFGEYSFGKKRIRLDYLGATKKYCADMHLEEQFIKAIRNDITNYYIEKNKLYLFSKDRIICKFDGIEGAMSSE